MNHDHEPAKCARCSRPGERGLSNAVLAVVGGVGVLVALALLVFLIGSLGGSSSGKRTADIYLSLGDSVAAGSGASDPQATSFPALLAAREDGVTLRNLAVAGATTNDVINEQLGSALVVLGTARVRFVTISVGGNDLAALIPNAACTIDPLPDTCPLAGAIDGVEGNLRAILDRVRDADPNVPVVLLAYPNFFSGSGHVFEAPASRVLPRLGEMYQRVAETYQHVAVAHPSFQGRSGELTHVLDPVFDPHPNDAGHRVIADAMAVALEEARRG